MYWAEALAKQEENAELKAYFAGVYKEMSENEDSINAELLSVQGSPVEIGGYYKVNATLVDAAMRPSATLNNILAEI